MACSRSINFGIILSSNILRRARQLRPISRRFCIDTPNAKLFKKWPSLCNRQVKLIHSSNRFCCDKDEKKTGINVDEEMMRYDYEEYEENVMDSDDESDTVEELPPHLSTRGERGVFDLDQIVQLLRDEKMKDICAISIDPELNYCEQMVIATGKSFRHLRAVAQKVNHYFKAKRHENDRKSAGIGGLEFIEGDESRKWLALDMGNIVLHLFIKQEREKYNLEELWTVGPEYDQQCLDSEIEPSPDFSSTSFDEALDKFRKSKTTDPTQQSEQA